MVMFVFSLNNNAKRVVFLSREFSTERLLRLDNLKRNPSLFKERKRVGRGPGSGLGKTSGRGHQFSRSTPRGFEGGQTPLYKLFPKIGFNNHTERDIVGVNLDTIQQYIDSGRLVPKENDFITMRDLFSCGLVTYYGDGIKLLSRGKSTFKTPLHFEVSFASQHAIKAVESVGGTVTCVHFNTLALRALMKPYKFELLPNRARPSPKIINYYLDSSKCGYLSPEVQLRNIRLFGCVTSEDKYRLEHENYIKAKRKLGLLSFKSLAYPSSSLSSSTTTKTTTKTSA